MGVLNKVFKRPLSLKFTMGWLFKKKKVPKVPLPEGHLLDDKALRFPRAGAESFEPMKVKQAVGFERQSEKPIMPTTPRSDVKMPMPSSMSQPFSRPMPVPSHLAPVHDDGSVHVSIHLYQKILYEMEGLNNDLSELVNINRRLVSSEFSEDNHFQKLKKSTKSLHDNLLQIDNILFSGQQGE